MKPDASMIDVETIQQENSALKKRLAELQLELARAQQRLLDIEQQGAYKEHWLEGSHIGLIDTFDTRNEIPDDATSSADTSDAMQQHYLYTKRLALKDIEQQMCSLFHNGDEQDVDQLNSRANDLTQVIAGKEQELIQQTVEVDIANPYLIGVPLTTQQHLFIERTDIVAKIERLLYTQDHASLLLYGQRRMGKTSLLNNLGRLLPRTILPLFVDMQGPPARSKDYVGFIYNIVRAIQKSARNQRNIEIPLLSRNELAVDPFTRFDEWLDDIHGILQTHDIELSLIMLDEFEVLHDVLQRENLHTDDVLGMLRHIIQHRPNVKVLLAGSLTPDELQPWVDYLINLQPVHISYLSSDHARILVEMPVKNIPLHYHYDATNRVIELTRGHPALVQLLCYEIVEQKNTHQHEQRWVVSRTDVDAAVPYALKRGAFFFSSIEQGRIDDTARSVLRSIAQHGDGAVVRCDALYEQFTEEKVHHALPQLLQRELIERHAQGYRIQIELMCHWLTHNAPLC